MNPKLQEFLSYCENKDSLVLFFRLAGELLEHLKLPDENEKVVLSVTKGIDGRRISFDLNSRLVLSLFQSGNMGFMLGREFIDRHKSELIIIKETKFTDREPIASFLNFPYDFVRDQSDMFKSEWLRCCKEYAPRNERSPYLNSNMPELLKYVKEPELILSEEIPDDNDDPDGKYFKDLMNSFKTHLEAADNVLKEFSFKRNTKRYCWISDKERVIGYLNAHSEIYGEGRELFVDLHFEGKDTRFNFRERVGDLPKSLSWMKWHKAHSIRTSDPVDLYDKEAVKKLSEKLLYLEESIGDKVRSVVKTLTQNQKNGTNMKSSPLNLILYGPPGTGKTYNSINKAISIINPGFDLSQDRKLVKAEFDKYVAEGRIAFTTFHQSMSYEDFIEGIKPIEQNESDSGVQYEIVEGIFKRLCRESTYTKSNFEDRIAWLKQETSEFDERKPITAKSGKSEFTVSYRGGKTFRVKPKLSVKTDQDYPASIDNIRRIYEGANRNDVYNPTYVVGILNYLYNHGLQKFDESMRNLSSKNILIIDEINRGNIAQIFGELITLIEEDKRLGNDEVLEAILPYSKEKFGVPRNLYIIGTMNTADRSVEALDTALRRRFSFEEISPDATLITKEIANVDIKGIMITINNRLEKLLDKDHLIGHSYFMKVENLADLKEVFQRNIIPLLQEYFFGDFGKIGLVLGTGFVEKIENESNRIFAKFYDYESSDLEDRPVYRIQKVSKMDDENFVTALNTLLRNDLE